MAGRGLTSKRRREVQWSFARLSVTALILCTLLLGLTPSDLALAALPSPELVSPANGAATNPSYDPDDPLSFPPEGVPEFKWNAVAGATKYHIDVDTAVGFNGTRLVNQDTFNTTYTPPSNTSWAGGQYYWHVCAIASNGTRGDGCEPGTGWTFTQGLDLSVSLDAPVDNPTADRGLALPFTPRFSWSPVAAADHYVLDISTDPSFGSHVSGYPLNTDATTYTPLVAFRNDTNYYWRVKAVDHRNNEGDWAPYRTFVMYWSYAGRRPTPMTPTLGAQNVGFPVFSWTPVQGAASYHLEVHRSPDASVTDPNRKALGVDTANTSYELPIDTTWNYQANTTYYWYVQAYNDNDQAVGQKSAIFSFTSGDGTPVVPSLLYPQYYYDPIATDPESGVSIADRATGFADPTVSVPTFMWDRLPGAHEYRIQIDNDLNFTSPVIDTNTSNLSYTPTTAVTFNPSIRYYWRVQAVDIGLWSQTWVTKIDTGRLATPIAQGGAPSLVRPTYKTEWDAKTYGQETIEFFPNLEWTAVQGATKYRIEFSKDSAFSSELTTIGETAYSNYDPTTQLPYGYGTYHWRVRVEEPSVGPWSDASRFILEIPPKYVPVYGEDGFPSTDDRDTDGDGTIVVNGANSFSADQSLSEDSTGRKLYAAIGKDYWYFGFDAQAGANATYLLYVDADHSDQYGGGVSAGSGLTPQAAAPHRPEYVVKLVVSGGEMRIDQAQAWLYSWDGTAWNGLSFYSVDWGHIPDATAPNGAAVYSDDNQFVELRIPKTVLVLPNMQNASSLSLKLFAMAGSSTSYLLPVELDGHTNTAQPFSQFATFTSAAQPVLPPNQTAGGSEALPLTPRFSWHTTDGAWTYRFQVATDGAFSSVVNFGEKGEGWVPNTMLYDAHNSSYTPTKAWSDNATFFWRMSVVNPFGAGDAWGETVTFQQSAFAPTNLAPGLVLAPSQTPPVAAATPKFSWDPVEGAVKYRLELIRDGDSFAAPWKYWETENTSYTPTAAIPDGTYSWRVRIKKANGSYGPASDVLTFTKQSPQVTLIGPALGASLSAAPTFTWQPVNGASYYTIQTATDANFSRNLKTVDVDNCAYTPTEAWTDKTTYYWRVQTRDGAGNRGPYNGARVLIDAKPFKVYLPLTVR